MSTERHVGKKYMARSWLASWLGYRMNHQKRMVPEISSGPRLYRSQILQANTSHLKAHVEIYTIHSFAQVESNLKTSSPISIVCSFLLILFLKEKIPKSEKT